MVHKRKKSQRSCYEFCQMMSSPWLLWLICICSLCMTFWAAIWLDNGKSWSETAESWKDDEAYAQTETMHLPKYKEDILLCSEVAKRLYDGELTVAEAVAYGKPDVPFLFYYLLTVDDGILEISEDQNMTEARAYQLKKEDTAIAIDNLKTGTTYYYRVSSGESIETGSFKTAESTRYINLPGAFNTRDIGGYLTKDGKSVKQGLLIRGTEIDGLVETNYYIPQKDIEGIQQRFGFAYDFDLRSETICTGVYESRFGKDVGHQFYDSPMYEGIFDIKNRETLRSIFSDLADRQKYPMYLHCTYGADRTGTIVFLLQGILNMAQEDMLQEYHLTGFFIRTYADSSYMDSVVQRLNTYDGNTLQEKIVTFLVDEIGVEKNEIASIREIFLESP